MRKRAQIMSIILILFFVISFSRSTALPQQDLEWKVKEGDSKTYTIDKMFDDSDFDGDGDKNTETHTVTDENGNEVDVVLKKGTTMKVKITDLNSVATIQFIYDGKVTSEETTDQAMVAKTVDNKTYWEEQAETLSDITDQEASVDGDLLVLEVEMEMMGVTITSILKTNWKTGWVTYTLTKAANSTDTISEIEVSIKGAGVPGFEIAPIVLGIVVITLLVYKKRK